MTTPSSRRTEIPPRRRIRPWLLLVLLGVTLALPPAARGHAELVASTPDANASLVDAPDELSLIFSEPIDQASIRIRLLDAQQRAVGDLGRPSLNTNGTRVAVSLPTLTRGTYTVDYQVTSAVDGHTTRGIFAFLLDPSGTEPTPALPTESSSPSNDPEVVATRWLALAAALAAAGTVIFWLLSARPALARAGGPTVDAPWALIVAASLLAAAALWAHLRLAAQPLLDADSAPPDWFGLDPAGPFGFTAFAVAMRIAVAGLVAGSVVAAARLVIGGNEARWLAATLVALAVGLAGMSLAGHAAASGGPAFAAIDWAHLVGVAAWLGSLGGVLAMAVRGRHAIGPAVRRHARVALVAAPIVVLTGLASSPLLLGDEPRELVGSGYGNLLLGKALLFSTAAGLGAVNFVLARRRPRATVSLGVIGAELGVAAAAVLVAAGMVTGQPAAARAPQLAATAIGTAHLYRTAGDVTVHAAINLPAPGPQRYQVSVSDALTGSYLTSVQRVFMVFTPPAESGLAPVRLRLTAADEPWLFGASGSYTPVVGDWQVEIIVRRPGVLDERATFPVAVRPLPSPQPIPPPDTGAGVPLPLAVLWRALPDGPAGWLVPILGLMLAAAAALVGRGQPRGGLLAAVRASVLLVSVLAGVGVGSRTVLDAANAPPATAATEPNPIEATAGSVERGRNLYLANCSACHGIDGEGDGPLADGIGTRTGPLDAAVPGLSDGEIAYRIGAGTVGTRMPAFAATLSASDRWDIVNYLRSRWPG